MQPYFLPYAGYFRLFAAADEVVLLDCVQFPRRGWVHRNKLARHDGVLDWLTLPLARASRDVRIADLAFAPDARDRLASERSRFPALSAPSPETAALVERIMACEGTPVALIEALIGDVCSLLSLPPPGRRSSEFALPPDLRGEARILQIARNCGATVYVNPPGGHELYDPASFAAEEMELAFLAPFDGPGESILASLHRDGCEAVGKTVRALTRLEKPSQRLRG